MVSETAASISPCVFISTPSAGGVLERKPSFDEARAIRFSTALQIIQNNDTKCGIKVGALLCSPLGVIE
jgi:hypothetical protein